ncbi:uncharacterized protein CC84DRAFT_1164963 [Paraphaeosphaeria sporulosa]|uniref:Uncharacterized protein n=1 Tax=Paraphaeosphaeria sporulosa TaxID=1460663 RepID=A0A177C9U1_9PLEO|nr:uncharacterized protein CC84DRAFT_1164963 [Paraphaeosphaeria sporulosa]OAG04514.1 hypothetical protein CC84DRAFT_1164963 [Paraphaeosphaeria sporulosa]
MNGSCAVYCASLAMHGGVEGMHDAAAVAPGRRRFPWRKRVQDTASNCVFSNAPP